MKLADAGISQLFETEAVWRNTKSKGVGQTTILKFLDGELEKSETLKLANKSIGQLFENQQAFANAKRKDTNGVGQTTILKFLGKNWKQWEILLVNAG